MYGVNTLEREGKQETRQSPIFICSSSAWHFMRAERPALRRPQACERNIAKMDTGFRKRS
jgi:hypothetical protein